MNLLDTLTDAQIAELPDDDAERFAAIVRLTRNKFEAVLSSGGVYRTSTDKKLAYAVELRSCAKALGIPSLPDWNITNSNVDTFLALAEGFVSEQRLLSDMKSRNSLVRLGERTKAEISTRLAGIRREIDASGLSESRKKALHVKLDAFEAELAKPKSNAAMLIGAIILVTATLSDVGGAVKTVQDSTMWIVRQVSEAHVSESRTVVELPNFAEAVQIEDRSAD